MNPTIVEGQIQGGVAHGIGTALFEEAVYDGECQLLTGSYMDYLVPTAAEVPPIEVGHQEFLSELNPFGIKGCGEGGAVAPPAAIANAIADAFRPQQHARGEQAMKVRGLVWVGTATDKYDETVRFFRDTLGLKPFYEREHLAVLQLDGGEWVEIFGRTTSTTRGSTRAPSSSSSSTTSPTRAPSSERTGSRS